MIDPDFGYFECSCGVFFQVLADDGAGSAWDQDASGVQMWDHWYAVHDKDRDGAVD